MCVTHPADILGALVSHPEFDCPGSSTQEGNFLVKKGTFWSQSNTPDFS